MNRAILAQIKELQRERGEQNPFGSELEFQTWADEVAPRLLFDPALQRRFRAEISTVRATYAWKGDAGLAANEAIGIVNQAAIQLEQMLSAEPDAPKPEAKPAEVLSPKVPEKLTWKWLWEHAPLSWWAWFAAVCVASFMTGVQFTKTPFYSEPAKPPVAESPSPAQRPASDSK